MCKISELKVLVVESNKADLDKTCQSLINLGVEMVLCVYTYQDAMTIIESDKTIDLVIADLRLENFKPAGVFLCEMAKKTRPELLFIISSKASGVAFLGESLYAGADATVDTTDQEEVDTTMTRWLKLAQKRREVEAILNK